jgi:hypothetical protein
MRMSRKALVGLLVLLFGVTVSAERMAVLVQCAIGIPPQAIRQLRLYTAQRAAAYSGLSVVPDHEVRRAEAQAGIFLGTYIPEDGVRKILRAVGAEYLLVVRIIGWEDKWEIRAERALLVSGVGLLDPTLGNLLGPLGLLSALDRRAEVTLLIRLYNQEGLIHANVISVDDAPFFLSWIFSDPMRAARKAVDMALKDVLQML